MKDIFFAGVHHENNPIKTKALIEHFFNRPPEEPRAWVWQTQSNGVVVRTDLEPVKGTYSTQDTIYPKNGERITARIRVEAKPYHRGDIDAMAWLSERADTLGMDISTIRLDRKVYTFEKNGKKWMRPSYEFFVVGQVVDEQALARVMNFGFVSQYRCWGFGFVDVKPLN